MSCNLYPYEMRSGTLPINEIFSSFQGEGYYTGTPATFIRLQGCSMNCSWCDTKYAMECDETKLVKPADVILKSEASETWAWMTLDDIYNIVKKLGNQHVIITGGEPFEHYLNGLFDRLLGYMVQVETNGSQEIPDCYRRVGIWLTISPKNVLVDNLRKANEIKWVVGDERDIENLKAIMCDIDGRFVSYIYLQPLNACPIATDLCIQEAMKNNWRISIQVHKLINMR